MRYRFTITGHIMPYVRMTYRGKLVNPRAIAYRASQERIGWQLSEQMMEQGWFMLPERTPLLARLSFRLTERLHCSDIDNQAKAVIDAAQGIVFRNDLWIDKQFEERELAETEYCILELEVI